MISSFKIGNLEISIPIIQGGMGIGVSLSGLASAVANEGGIGVISAAGVGLLYKRFVKDYEEARDFGLRAEIRKAKEKTKGIIGVNAMVALTNYNEIIKICIEEEVDIIFSGAGLPLDLPQFHIPGCKTKLVPIVSSARAARILCEKWKMIYDYLPDAFVVEGPKAGGHLGFSRNQLEDENYSLEQLIPQVVKEVEVFEKQYNVEIPIIAAGGVYTGADIFAIMQKGAKAVQMGSRFVGTVECDASEAFKQSYINAKEEDLQIIQSPVGMPGRVIRNSFIDDVNAGLKKPINCPIKCLKTCDVEKAPYCIMQALLNAYKGNLQSGFMFAGLNAYRVEKITTVKELFKELLSEFEEAKINFASKFTAPI